MLMECHCKKKRVDGRHMYYLFVMNVHALYMEILIFSMFSIMCYMFFWPIEMYL